MITFLLVVIILQLGWLGIALIKLNNNFVKWTKFHQGITEPWRHDMYKRRNNV